MDETACSPGLQDLMAVAIPCVSTLNQQRNNSERERRTTTLKPKAMPSNAFFLASARLDHDNHSDLPPSHFHHTNSIS